MEQTPKNLPLSKNLHFLIEVRSRLLRSILILFLIFSCLIYFANDLYGLLAAPLLKFLPQGHLIATRIVSPFFVPFKLTFVIALFLSAPFFLYQVWQFVAPALYVREKKIIWPFLLLSIFLFYAGILFAYLVIFPLLFHFIATIAPKEVIVSPDISEYLDFTLKLLMIFGALFEIPIVMVMVTLMGWLKRERLRKWRPYAFLTAFILGMFLAPPDVFSQTLIAIPIWLLYELGLFFSWLTGAK